MLFEIDASSEALEQELLTCTAPVAKETLALDDEAAQLTAEVVGQMKQHVLDSFIGEQRIL